MQNSENTNLLADIFETIEVCNCCNQEGVTSLSNYNQGGGTILDYCPTCHAVEQGTKTIQVPIEETL